MSLKTDLARVRGLGSAKDGTHHFWHQRLTAIALIPLSIWFVTALLCMFSANHADVVEWIAAPHVTTLMVALVAALYYHIKLGMQTVIEDYIHTEWLKFTCVIALNLGVLLCGLISIVAILKISFGSN
jgi:succinate dehydrogenase / fumarate reductase membrane anchor subunit